jgi:hypothetical protein
VPIVRNIALVQSAYRLTRLAGKNSVHQPAWGALVRLAAPWLTEAVATEYE